MRRRTKSPITVPEEHIQHVNFSGLKGRIAVFPAQKKSAKRTFVLISGHHTSHERMLSFAQYLADFGTVYSIDMPGFGGMNSFASIGRDITYDSYAEYLYTILKSKKLTDDITIFAISIGGQYVTRMLQRYPQTQDWVRQVVGLVTFGAGKDFHLSWKYKLGIVPLIRIGRTAAGSRLLDILIFNRLTMFMFLNVFARLKKKMKTTDQDLRRKNIQMETYLWTINDHRTQATTTCMMFYDDLRRYSQAVIKTPMLHLMTKSDQYVDYKEVNKTMRDLYDNYQPYYLELDVHMPSLITDKGAVAAMFDQATVNEIIK